MVSSKKVQFGNHSGTIQSVNEIIDSGSGMTFTINGFVCHSHVNSDAYIHTRGVGPSTFSMILWCSRCSSSLSTFFAGRTEYFWLVEQQAGQLDQYVVSLQCLSICQCHGIVLDTDEIGVVCLQVVDNMVDMNIQNSQLYCRFIAE